MARPRSSPWYDSSHVFADTRRVDLFDDPPWETSPPTTVRPALVDEARPGSRRTGVRAGFLGRVLAKRGQHSQKPA